MSKLKLPKTIKVIISDFDGVLTDNCVYIDNNLNMSRKINFKDVMAVVMLKRAGIETIFVSGEKNAVIDLFKEKFNLVENHQDIRKKIVVLKDIIKRFDLKPEEYLYIGDDVNDQECLEFSQNRITVPNTVEEIRKIPNIQMTEKSGGEGAFREVADCLLKHLK